MGQNSPWIRSFFPPTTSVRRVVDRSEARWQYARTYNQHKHSGFHCEALTARARWACGCGGKTKKLLETGRFICRRIFGSCALCSLSTFRPILAAVRAHVHACNMNILLHCHFIQLPSILVTQTYCSACPHSSVLAAI